MFKSKQQREKEHNKNRLLYNGFEGLARSNKPDLAGVPKRFAQYTPLDIYQSFVPAKLDYKGQLCSGYVKRGWSLKVGLTGEFDFSFLLAEFGVGQLQPIANIGYTKTKFSLAIVQRFPQELLYWKTADGKNQGASGVGQAGPEPENVTKWRIEKPITFATMLGNQTAKSIELGIDFQWGKTLFTVAGPGIAEDGTNDAGIGVGANIKLSGKWESLHVVDRNPGWYESSLDANLQKDFLNYLGPKDARDLKREIFQWLRHSTELDINWLPNERIKGDAKKAIKQISRMPAGVDPTGGIDTLEAALKWLPPLNMFNGPLDKLKDFTTKPQRQKLIDELKKLATALSYIRDNKDENGQPLAARLRIVLLAQTRSILDLQLHRVTTYIAELEQYDAPGEVAPVDPLGLPPPQPKKLGTLTPGPVLEDSDGRLSYVRISTSEALASARGGPRLIVPVFAQIISVGTVDAGISVSASYRKSVSRFQSFCYDLSMTPLVATQDTMLTYSRVGLEANATAQFANFFYDKTLDSAGTSIKAKKTLLNSIDYQSVVVYWPKLRSGGVSVKVCRGSGVRFGCSVLLSRIKRLLKNPEAADSKKLLKGLTQALRVDWTTLRNFFLSMDIDKTLPTTGVPPSLLIESAFPFPDGMTVPVDLQSGTGELRDLLSEQKVLDFSKKLGKANGPKPETLRLRMRQADWALTETNVSTDFRLGFWAVDSIPAVISLKEIKEAGREVIIDLYTQFITNPEYNRNPVASQEKVVPPVALLHQ